MKSIFESPVTALLKQETAPSYQEIRKAGFTPTLNLGDVDVFELLRDPSKREVNELAIELSYAIDVANNSFSEMMTDDIILDLNKGNFSIDKDQAEAHLESLREKSAKLLGYRHERSPRIIKPSTIKR